MIDIVNDNPPCFRMLLLEFFGGKTVVQVSLQHVIQNRLQHVLSFILTLKIGPKNHCKICWIRAYENVSFLGHIKFTVPQTSPNSRGAFRSRDIELFTNHRGVKKTWWKLTLPSRLVVSMIFVYRYMPTWGNEPIWLIGIVDLQDEFITFNS